MGFIGDNEKEEEIQEEDEEETDIYKLFSHYNSLYFDDALGSCLFSWSSHRQMNSDHGLRFQEVRNSINSISIIDAQRPHCGYNITLHHEFKKDVTEHKLEKEIKTYKFYHWTCDTCGDFIKKSRELSDRDCIDKAGPDKSCVNLSCHWHNHKNACPGSYVIKESPKYKEKQTCLTAEQERVTFKEQPNKARQSTGGVSETEATSRETDSKGEQELQPPRATRKSCPNERSSEKSHGKKAMRTADCLQPAEESHATRKRRYTGKKRGGYRNGESRDAFRGDWLCMYGDEEEDEAVEPLVNKRTERRKRLKLLLQTAGEAATETESGPLMNN